MSFGWQISLTRNFGGDDRRQSRDNIPLSPRPTPHSYLLIPSPRFVVTTYTSKTPKMRLTWCLVTLPFLLSEVMGVKQEDFKLCSQSSFCRRLRSIANRQESSPSIFLSPYSVGPASTTVGTIDHASWSFPVTSSLYPEISFEIRVDILEKGDGIARIRMDEVGSKTPFKRYNETARWALVHPEPKLALLSSAKLSSSNGISKIIYGAGLSIEIQHHPLKITQYRDGKPQVVFNERSLLHMEHFRLKEQEKIEEPLSEGEQVVLKGGEMDRSWFEESDADQFEERWKTWTDSKPKGSSYIQIGYD